MSSKKGYKTVQTVSKVEGFKKFADSINETTFTINEIVTVLESEKKISGALVKLDLVEPKS